MLLKLIKAITGLGKDCRPNNQIEEDWYNNLIEIKAENKPDSTQKQRNQGCKKMRNDQPAVIMIIIIESNKARNHETFSVCQGDYSHRTRPDSPLCSFGKNFPVWRLCCSLSFQLVLLPLLSFNSFLSFHCHFVSLCMYKAI